MRKILFFLLCLPALASLGHDAYVYYEEPDKGFRLSDLGAIWDKHHKESHDQWKTKVQEIGQSVDELVDEGVAIKDVIPEDLTLENIVPEKIENMLPEGFISEKDQETTEKPAQTEEIIVEEVVEEGAPEVTENFSGGFTQSIDREGTTHVTVLEEEEDTIGENTGKVISVIGFLLEQKAALVLGAVPLFFFLLNCIFSALFGGKDEMDTVRGIKKTKRKGGGYKYTRK